MHSLSPRRGRHPSQWSHVRQGSGRKQGRDRDPHLPHAAGDGHRLGRRVLGGRPRITVRGPRRRGLPDRPRTGRRELPDVRDDHPHRPAGGSRGGAPGVRIPCRERKLRARMRRGRPRVRRPAAGGDRRDGLQDQRPAGDGGGRRAGDPRHQRAGGDGRAGARDRRRDRLPGGRQGVRRGWRQGHRGGPRRAAAAARLRLGAAAGPRLLRRRHGVHGALPG